VFAYLVSSVVPGDLLSDNEHSLVSDHLLHDPKKKGKSGVQHWGRRKERKGEKGRRS